MKNSKTILAGLLCGVMLLSACGSNSSTSVQTSAQTQQQVPAAAEPPEDVPQTAEVLLEEYDTPAHGLLVHIERVEKDAYDPAEGKNKILTYAWDNVRVDSEENPEVAAAITEEMAARQDMWYTGAGESEADNYGYNAILAAAEDNYAIYAEFGGTTECSATRFVTVLRADENICIFMVNTYYYLGGVHGTYDSEAICFDARTGDLLSLKDLTDNLTNAQDTMVNEMMRQIHEDADGYYSEALSLTEPDHYEDALLGLLRDGSWYPGRDGFHVFSKLYELGPYYTGSVDFCIPWDTLQGVIDSRWQPKPVAGTAGVQINELSEIPEGVVEIADRVVIGDGGESSLILFSGEARDVSIWTVYMGDRFYPEAELFYCGQIADAALQISLLMPGDLPNTMLCYSDADGDHEYLIGRSGEDGSMILVANTYVMQG